jgi:branched-chain amino acid transport system ATP-binding protein
MHKRVRLGLTRSFQITSVFQRLSVQDNMALAAQAQAVGSLNFWQLARLDSQRYAWADEVIERVGLTAYRQQLAGALSHGQQRQLEVGLALATRPQLLLLDEPMAGMGPDESERMVGLLQSLRGVVTLLLVEHDMNAVFRLAERISVLVAGRVIACGSPEAIRNHPAVCLAYLGDNAEATL